MKKPRENERISDLDLRHIFDKVDLNQDSYVNRMVITLNETSESLLNITW